MAKNKRDDSKKNTEEIKEETLENSNETTDEEVKAPSGNEDELVEAGENQEEDVEIEQDEENPLRIFEEKIREQENRYLRLAAEYDNYRKRTLREKADLTKMAGADIIAGLLPVVDDLDRAVDAMDNVSDIDAMKKGIELIHGKFKDFLSRKGVKEIEARGSELDTDLHEAVTKIPAPAKKDKGKIVDVIEKGYLMNDTVIRYAKVVVGE